MSRIDELVVASSTFVLAGSSVKLELDQAEDLWPAEVDSTQIGQVVQNLAVNAAQAMPQGGSLKIRSRNLELFEHDGELKAGSYILIEFEDEGVGIPPPLLDKIFDPYFTTKESGSGLGLATTYSVLTRHGGSVRVSSQPGVGTVFCLYIPASLKAPKRTHKEERVSLEAQSGGKVLVMDDEASVRRVLRKMLERSGYQCVEACDGVEAVDAYKEALQEEAFCCVILDLTIPGGLSGEKVLAKLKEIDPAIRAIVASGYAAQGVMADHQSYGFVARLAKPFGVKELRATLDRVLNVSRP